MDKPESFPFSVSVFFYENTENKHHAVYDYNTIVIMRRLIVVSVYLVKALHAYTCPYFSPVGIKASISPLLYMSESSPDDNSFVDYSSSLTPRQEWDQINSELGFAQDRNWKRFLKRPLKIIGKSISKLVESEKKTGTLILVRCGESEYSGNYTFTGWLDADLTKNGQSMMRHAGRLLLASGYEPDIIYTSRLKRAIKSAWAIVQEISTPFLPVYKSWRLNERHYGSLQGLSKTETAKRLGKEVVQAWRRSLKSRPPLLKISDPQYPGHDKKYADLFPEQIPRGESLLDCMRRTKPLWEFIKKDIQGGKSVLIVAHAASLRGIAKIIDDIDDEQISEVSFPKGIPVVYKFDKSMLPIKPEGKDALLLNTSTSGYFLENPELLQKALKITKEWEEDVPGSQGRNLNILKRMNTVEQSLLQLRSEQEEWPIDERFEIEMSVSPKQEVVKANVNIFSNPKDPVVVLVRHGRTPHNQLGLFTGWEDPALAPEGEEDARNAGRLLKKYGFEFDVVYSSWLYRAIQTAWFILEEMDMLWLPMIKSWRLNERHYGALTGLSKKMVENIHGERQLKNWRRGYTTRPPAISSYSPNYPGNDRRRVKYVKDLRISLVETICRSIEDRKLSLHRKFPKCESLKDCMDRSIPFYTQKIVPEAVSKGKRVLISSHENAIRGILMHLCEIPEEHMNDLHLPNGIPLVYSVKRKCITLLDDGSEENLLEKYDFGSAAQFLFRPCEIEEDEDWFIPSSLRE